MNKVRLITPKACIQEHVGIGALSSLKELICTYNDDENYTLSGYSVINKPNVKEVVNTFNLTGFLAFDHTEPELSVRIQIDKLLNEDEAIISSLHIGKSANTL